MGEVVAELMVSVLKEQLGKVWLRHVAGENWSEMSAIFIPMRTPTMPTVLRRALRSTMRKILRPEKPFRRPYYQINTTLTIIGLITSHTAAGAVCA